MELNEMWLEILMLLAGLVFLYFGGDWLVDGASRLAASLGVSTFVIGLTIVAIGTSAPEAAVALASVSQGEPSISFGNIVGSNIANVGIVLAVACLICPMVVRMPLLKREAVFLAVSILAIAAMGFDGTLSRANGLVLLVAALAFNIFVLRAARLARPPRERGELGAIPAYRARWKHLAWSSLGILMLAIGSELVLLGGVEIANQLGMDEFVIGLTVVAVGTSIPELAVSITSACKKDTSLLLGNIMGSNISNSLLVLGLASSISPIDLPDEFFTLTLPITLVLYATLIGFMYIGNVLNRKTASILMVTYVLYIILLFI